MKRLRKGQRVRIKWEGVDGYLEATISAVYNDVIRGVGYRLYNFETTIPHSDKQPVTQEYFSMFAYDLFFPEVSSGRIKVLRFYKIRKVFRRLWIRVKYWWNVYLEL